ELGPLKPMPQCSGRTSSANRNLAIGSLSRDIGTIKNGGRRMKLRRCILAGIVSVVTTCSSAFAHPHVWVVIKSQIVYDKAGLMTGIRHVWAFDDVYSAFITQGIKPKRKGS